jgi:hypothetical protein
MEKTIDDRPDVLRNIETNYNEAFHFLLSRKQRQVNQLVLLNNLQRGDENIASTLLLTLFNRIMSNLYDDKIQVKFLPSQGILQEQLNSYNTLSQSDYIEMDKAKLDYDWCWDTLFFGRGYMETLKFNMKRKIMEPQVINPLVFGYDPYFENKDDWRYYWKWVTKSKWQINKLIKNGEITGIKDIKEIPAGVDPYLWQYKTKRDQAKKATEPSMEPAKSDVYQILEYFGYDEDGKKCVYWTDRMFSKILRKEVLDLKDGESYDGGETFESRWPIIIKEAFREPHSTVNFSVADLLEDKHRAKSVLLNLAFIAAKDKANPLYWYNENVKDVTQLFSRQINQHIALEGNQIGDSSIGPLNTQEPMSAGLIEFISMLTNEAEQPVGTGSPTNRQATSKKGDTATQVAIDQQLNDLAQSLQSKVMQFGESEFWSHWFHRYAVNAKELGKKMANVVGVKGISTTEIDFKDFNTDFPPGVMVYSAKEAEYKELVVRRDLMQIYPEMALTLDKDGMRNFQKHIFFPKFLQDPSLIDIMLPKTLDEMTAEGENEQLTKNSMPDVKNTDNHTTHIYTHYMVQPKTWATWVHISWHQDFLAKQKQQEMLQMQMQQAPPEVGKALGGAGAVGQEKQNPVAQASPLKTETTNSLTANNY